MFEKEIVVDGKGHLIGRLCSKIAKELLQGQKVVVVRCEQILRSGSLFRNKLIFKEYLNKSVNTNPRKGHIHYRTPCRIFWRTVRGMVPHKTARGVAAMQRLKVFDGIPYPYDHKKRMVVPEALKISCLRDNRKYCQLGDIAKLGGWTRKHVVERLEERRKVKAGKYWVVRKQKIDARQKAGSSKEV